MSADEQAIRDLVATWLRASAAGDLDTVLGLMAPDVVFLGPGHPPMRGREAFAAVSRANAAQMRLEGRSDVQEVQVAGDLAYCWTQIAITVTPLAGGAPRRLAGPALSILRKQPDGRWVIVRDANMVTPEASA